MIDCKPTDSPMVGNHDLYLIKIVEPIEKEQYQRLDGKRIYLLILDKILLMRLGL